MNSDMIGGTRIAVLTRHQISVVRAMLERQYFADVWRLSRESLALLPDDLARRFISAAGGYYDLDRVLESAPAHPEGSDRVPLSLTAPAFKALRLLCARHFAGGTPSTLLEIERCQPDIAAALDQAGDAPGDAATLTGVHALSDQVN